MLEGLTPKKQSRPCKVKAVLDSLDAKDQKILEEALSNSAWSTKGLADALNNRGISISDTPIASHRSGRCSCVRES
jgi:hypothetical protein